MALDLLQLTIGDYIKKNQGIPPARKRRGSGYRPIVLPALQSAKIELYNAFKASGLTKAEFARRLGIPITQIERLFSLRHQSRLDQVDHAFAALGKRLDIAVSDAA